MRGSVLSRGARRGLIVPVDSGDPGEPGGSTGDGVETSGETTGSTFGKTIVSTGANHAKGDWVELIASADFDAEKLILTYVAGVNAPTTDSSTLIDVGFGAAGSEAVKIGNINYGFSRSYASLVIPFAIPTGTRVSARCQTAGQGQDPILAACLREAGDHSAAPTACDTMGANAATSNGVVPTVAGAINTKSAWTEVEDSTAHAYTRLLVTISGTPTNAHTAATGLVDVGLWNGSSYDVIVPNIGYATNSSESIGVAGAELAFTVTIPVASRLGFRYQATSTTDGARPTVILHGLY